MMLWRLSWLGLLLIALAAALLPLILLAMAIWVGWSRGIFTTGGKLATIAVLLAIFVYLTPK